MTMQRWIILGCVLYVVLIAVVVYALFDARKRMTAVYAAPDEQSHWEDFGAAMRQRHVEKESLREELSRHSGQPVAAAPPKTRSERPPTLELLENHFVACLAIAVAGASMLFALLWAMLMGAMLRPGRPYEDSAESDSPPAAAN